MHILSQGLRMHFFMRFASRKNTFFTKFISYGLNLSDNPRQKCYKSCSVSYFCIDFYKTGNNPYESRGCFCVYSYDFKLYL
jgi:hypothetical protein